MKTTQEIDELARETGQFCGIFEISAKINMNVKTVFEFAANVGRRYKEGKNVPRLKVVEAGRCALL